MDGRGWVEVYFEWVEVGGHFLWVGRGGLGVGWVGIFLLVGGEWGEWG